MSDEHAKAPVVEDEDAPLDEVGHVGCDRGHQPPPDGDEELFVEPESFFMGPYLPFIRVHKIVVYMLSARTHWKV